jgi:hypothetical protein
VELVSLLLESLLESVAGVWLESLFDPLALVPLLLDGLAPCGCELLCGVLDCG